MCFQRYVAGSWLLVLLWTHYFGASGSISSSHGCFGGFAGCCDTVFADCLSEQRAASRSKESINDESGMQALMSLSQRRVDDKTSSFDTTTLSALFLLQRPEGEEGDNALVLDLFLLFAFNSLKPDTHSEIQTCMKNS